MESAIVPAPVRSLTSVAFERLRVDILAGELLPAERLRIQALSERYQVGATAIREALSRLVTEGLVTLEEQRGFSVTPVSSAELVDLTQTRVRVEQMALRLAVEHGDIEWESRLLSAFHRLSRTPPPTSPERDAQWSAVHRAFHEALIDGCASA
ncbi:MAG TPA: GntR family transcriptional regulator, partial [Burkholderiaceae bacterium]|nr:GntR family transcriptional regulator [Burkholderiaceae bacterium]